MTSTPTKVNRQSSDARNKLDVEAIRTDFPILSQSINGNPLVYLDSAATSQKPASVIETVQAYYRSYNANIHRGVHTLSQKATQAYEDARLKVQRFLNAPHVHEIIFLRGTTEAINLVAQSYARPNLVRGDEVLVTHMEHHSNIVPWQMVCEQTGATLNVAPVNDRGELMIDEFENLLSDKTKVVSVVHVSNALGSINPVSRIAELAHAAGAVVVVDGAQAVPHLPIDVQELGVDFYAFSGHKLYGPTGVGVLFGRGELLDAMPPYQGGGDMIKSVTFEKTTYNELPYKFEAGTANIVGPIGLAAAIDYIQTIGYDAIGDHESDLLEYATAALDELDGVRIIGTAREKAAVVSFVIDGVHPHDVGTILDQQGVAIRTGHHCTQPLMDRFGVPATARASLALYNIRQEVDILATALQEVIKVFK